jgi:predicted transcriptional regulator of viral defense system
MNQIQALAKIEALSQPFVDTRDIAALLNQKTAAASLTANRLTKAGFLIKLSRGKWAVTRNVNPLAIPEHLTAPHPSYISLQSALFHHGMISQIPNATYAVSLAKSRQYKTPIGVFSVHHAESDFFYGYELDSSGWAKIAVPEKALLDILYFAPTKSRLFGALPELELPGSFSWKRVSEMAARIKSSARRKFVEKAVASIRQQR